MALSLVVMLNPSPLGPFVSEMLITFPILRVLLACTAAVTFEPAAGGGACAAGSEEPTALSLGAPPQPSTPESATTSEMPLKT